MPANRKRLLAAISLLACLTMGFGPPMLTDGDIPSRTLTPQQLRAMQVSTVPAISAESAILVNVSSREVLYEKNAHERRAPASFTKLATALVALQRGNLEEEYPVWPVDLSATTAAGLRNGEYLTLWQLLHMMLIPSDNAAANCIARNMGGNVATFVGWMNELAESLGLEDTQFANAHGLDHPDLYSTAYDMAILALYAMQDDRIADIVAYDEAVVAKHWLINTNKLLMTYPGTVGIKTGTTDDAEQCLIAMVRRPQGTVMSIVMGSQDRFLDSVLLLDHYYANYAEITVSVPNTPLNRFQDDDGIWRSLSVKEPVTILVHPWQTGTVSIFRRIDDTRRGLSSGSAIGMLEISIGGKVVRSEPLYVR
jgi:serine-type D-Ala-D-Ala carboxypeptidase (penicillin-binding protein 5/6)